MKQKFTLLSGALLCTVSAMAEIGSTPVTRFGDISLEFIPLEYTIAGEDAKLYSSRETDAFTQFRIFDSNFKGVETFSTSPAVYKLEVKRYSKLQSVTVELQRTSREVMTDGAGPRTLATVYETQYEYGRVRTPEEAYALMRQYASSDFQQEVKDNVYYFYMVNEFYNPDQYGTKYCRRYGMWKPDPAGRVSPLIFFECEFAEVPTYPLEQATDFCESQGFFPNIVDGKQCFYPAADNSYEFFAYSRFGTRYPRTCYHLDSEGVLTQYRIEYSATPQMADDWILERGYYEDSYNLSVSSITPLMSKYGNVDMNGFDLSQTLFNNTSDYEYVWPITEVYNEEEFGTDYIDGIGQYEVKTVRQRDRIIGYKVISQYGNEVAKVTLEAGYTASKNLGVIDFGDKRYLTIEAQKYDEQRDETIYYTFVYAIDPSSSGTLQMVCDPIEVTVAPRIARQSTPINVNFSGESKAQRQIVVTAVNGMTVMTQNVAAGETSASIDTSRLGQGMYIVSVVENGKKTENCKVIIR